MIVRFRSPHAHASAFHPAPVETGPRTASCITLLECIRGGSSMFSRSLAPGHIKSGKLRALAVTGAKRLPYLPDVPTLTEAGIPGMEIDAGWFGMFAPVNTAPPVVARPQSEVRTALANPLASERFTEQGFVPVGNTPPESETIWPPNSRRMRDGAARGNQARIAPRPRDFVEVLGTRMKTLIPYRQRASGSSRSR